jgi:hypothetical protein
MLADPSARKRFRKEALILSRLNHPNIAVVYDFDSQEGLDFLGMDGGVTAIAVQWPGGRTTETPVPQGAREVKVTAP